MSTPKNDGVPLEHPAKSNFGPLLDDFIKEFGCDPAKTNEIAAYLAARPPIDTDAQALIRRTRIKIAKRSESAARAFSETVDALRACSDLSNADDLIRFIITCSSGHKTERSQRAVRIAAANAALLDDLRTPTRAASTMSSSSTRTLLATSTPSSAYSGSASTIHKKIFLPMEVEVAPKPAAVLNGRCKGRTVVCSEEMIRQTVWALVGSEGRYITRGAAPEDRLVVAKHCAVDDALHAQLESLLCVANAYCDLQRIAQRHKSGLLAQAFTLCLSDVIAEYIAIVSKLESQLTISRESVTPLLIQHELGDWPLRMQCLAHIAANNESLKGTALLNNIYAAYCCTSRDSSICHSLCQILRALLAVFHEVLREWLLYGRLNSSTSEWMIVKEESAQYEDPWTGGYRIVQNAVPIFFDGFPRICQQILVVGKSMALLSSMGVADRSLAERRHLFSTFDSLECYYLPVEMQKFFRTITGFYERINSEVMRNVVIEFNMRTHAELVQKHFLMTDENLALTFYSQIIEETNGDMSALDSQKVCRAFSSAKATCDSWPTKLSTVARVDATCGLMEDELGVLPSPRDPNGGPIVQLRYIANAPVSIIFNEAAMGRYQHMFTFIWTILCADFQLVDLVQKYSHLVYNAWRIWPDFRPLCHLFNAVLARMAQFLCVLRFHIVHSVIEVHTQKFNMELGEWSNDLDKLIEAHEQCLRGLEEGLFLVDESKDVRTLIASLCDLIFEAVDLHSKFTSELIAATATKTLSRAVERDFDDTARFEFEEERIREEETYQRINIAYLPLIRNINDKFVRQMSDLVEEMLHREAGVKLPNLAMQLDFTGYYLRNGVKTKFRSSADQGVGFSQ
uniref:Gamma-tubulin complex component n=1 Tax=Ascaris suum TaxID=6253 RepID=F1KTP8_ASCSU